MSISMIESLNDSSWSFLERSLIPPSDRDYKNYSLTLVQKGVSFLVAIPCVTVTSGLAITQKIFKTGSEIFSSKSEKENEGFSAVVKDSRKWKDLGNIEESLLMDPPGGRQDSFLYGTASCTYQDSGYFHCPDSQWLNWEKKILAKDNQSNKSANLFELYKTDPTQVIDRLKALGVNSYRTSVEWSHIEPVRGEFVPENLEVYVNFCKILKDNGIKPMVTLHHFSEPLWFHEMGSFEKEENIEHFVKYSEYVYKELTQDYHGKPLVEYFCTINEPSIEGFSRYVRGAYSPGIIFNFHRAAHFIKGAMKAHFVVYNKLKEMNRGKDIQIGFTHQYLKFVPDNILLFPVTRYLTNLINNTVLNLFRTGEFSLKVPLLCNVVEIFDPELMGADFVGVQYYTRPFIGLTGSKGSNEDEVMTAMPFREDPAGLYESICETHRATGKPIIVTENGISTQDDMQRSRYMTRALYALREAENDLGSEVVKGYFQWSFVDNLEWDMGMRPQAFGAFQLKKELGENRIMNEPKEGMSIFTKIANSWRQMISESAA